MHSFCALLPKVKSASPQSPFNARMRQTTKYLLYFGFGGSFLGTGIIIGLSTIIHAETLNKSTYGAEGKRTFYQNPTIRNILGTPIKELDIKMGYQNICEAEMEIPVQGTINSGTMYIYATKNLQTGDWKLEKLSLKSDDSERTIYTVLPPENGQ